MTKRTGIQEQIAQAERTAFENSLPMSLQQLKDLFSHLNAAEECDHTFRDTLLFLSNQSLESSVVIPWLEGHGGHCDCEVIYNVYDAVGEQVGWHLDA